MPRIRAKRKRYMELGGKYIKKLENERKLVFLFTFDVTNYLLLLVKRNFLSLISFFFLFFFPSSLLENETAASTPLTGTGSSLERLDKVENCRLFYY